jgi:hypothetical protein
MEEDIVFILLRVGGIFQEFQFDNKEEAHITLDEKEVTNGLITLRVREKPRRVQVVHLTNYFSPSSLCDELNQLLQKFHIQFSLNKEKCLELTTLPDHYALALRHGMEHVLGFQETVLLTSPYTAPL